MNSERVRMMKQEKKVYSFGGYEVARGNLYYNNGYHISDNPVLHSFGTYWPKRIGTVENSTYFLPVTKNSTGFTYELQSLNLAYNGKSGWHLPSSTEYWTILGCTISGGSYSTYYTIPNRQGSTFNGTTGALFVGAKVNINGELVPPTTFTYSDKGAGWYNGLILFPDGETITSTYNFSWVNNATYRYGQWSSNTISESVLIDLLNQGCAFFPMLGTYQKYDLFEIDDWQGNDDGFPNTNGTHYYFSPYMVSDYYKTYKYSEFYEDYEYYHKVGYFAVITDDKEPGVDYQGPLFKCYDASYGVNISEIHLDEEYHYMPVRMVRKI